MDPSNAEEQHFKQLEKQHTTLDNSTSGGLFSDSKVNDSLKQYGTGHLVYSN